MARIHHTFTALTLGIATMSASASAQAGGSTSLTHTVSVTVPSRVRVQVAPVALRDANPTEAIVGSATTRGLSLRVKATRAWVLSVESKDKGIARKNSLRWSADPTEGFSKLHTSPVVVASGGAESDVNAAQLFFQTAIQSDAAVADDASSAEIVLTVTAQ